MKKKHFIALADAIKWDLEHNPQINWGEQHLGTIADFCKSQSPRFNRERWLGYIAGTNGPCGGKHKRSA